MMIIACFQELASFRDGFDFEDCQKFTRPEPRDPNVQMGYLQAHIRNVCLEADRQMAPRVPDSSWADQLVRIIRSIDQSRNF